MLAICFLTCGSLDAKPCYSDTSLAIDHDLEFWQQIIQDDFAIPENESAIDLANELSDLLASPDPVLRDEIAYRILTQWIYVKEIFTDQDLSSFLRVWSGNMSKGIGEPSADSVLLRSFSALNLATIAALDNKTEKILDQRQFEELLMAGIEFLDQEKDLRGWTTEQGWIHATAHTADLLKFLGRSRHLSITQQAVILEAIAKRLGHTEGYIFVHDEDGRLSAAVISILNRDDFELKTLESFLQALDEQCQREGGEFNMDRFAAQQNKKNFLRSLYFQLAARPKSDAQALKIREILMKRLSR